MFKMFRTVSAEHFNFEFLLYCSCKNSFIELPASQRVAQRGRIKHPRKLKFSAVLNFNDITVAKTK